MLNVHNHVFTRHEAEIDSSVRDTAWLQSSNGVTKRHEREGTLNQRIVMAAGKQIN